MKECGVCKQVLPLDRFSLKRGLPQWSCKECHSKYRKQHYQANKQKYIDKAQRNREKYQDEFYQWLSFKSCVDCGNADIRVLELDHLFDKKYNISKKISQVKLETLMVELEKCEVVCANCHRIRTSTRANWNKNKYALQAF